MALPSHASLRKTRLPNGVRYFIDPPQLPEVVGEIEHVTLPGAALSTVRYRVRSAGREARWASARNVPTAIDRAQATIASLIRRSVMEEDRRRFLQHRFPRPCPKCAAPAGRPCVTASGRSTDTHAAR